MNINKEILLAKAGKTLLLLSLPLQIFLLQLVSTNPEWVEAFYTGALYKYLSLGLRMAFGWTPLPFGQFLLYGAIAGVLIWIAWLVKGILKKKTTRKQFALDFGFGALTIVSGF